VIRGRGLEQQQHQGINQKTVRDMNQQIDQVIPEDIKSIKVVIERKGQKPHSPVSGKAEEVRKILNLRILDNVGGVIKIEGRGEGVGVDKRSQKGEEEKER